MDNFLQEQTSGQLVDSDNSFTVSPEKAREKILHSIPEVTFETVFRLLDAALLEQGYEPWKAIAYRAPHDHNLHIELFRVTLADFGLEPSRALIEELRNPFGNQSGIRRLAQAIFIATQNGKTVSLTFKSSLLSLGQSLTLRSGHVEVPPDFVIDKAESLTLEIEPNRLKGNVTNNGYTDHTASINRKLQSCLHTPERILPRESLVHSVGGSFFQGRVRPFTAIRSYAHGSSDDSVGSMHVDIWKGPYTSLDSSTVILEQKSKGGFLFFRWRPNYGRPTFLHHSLNSDLNFGPQTCRGTFMIIPSDEPAHIYVLSEGIVADPIPIVGVKGLVGLVTWPGFRYDLWGTRPVKNATFEASVEWAQAQARATADCLATHLEEVIERITASTLLKASYYADEVARWMRTHWG